MEALIVCGLPGGGWVEGVGGYGRVVAHTSFGAE